MNLDKAEGLFKLRINEALAPFKDYGMDIYRPGASKAIWSAYITLLKPYITDSIGSEEKYNE